MQTSQIPQNLLHKPQKLLEQIPESVSGSARLEQKKETKTAFQVTAAATAFFAGLTVLSYLMYSHHCPNGFRLNFKCICSGAITAKMGLLTGLLAVITTANGIEYFSSERTPKNIKSPAAKGCP